MDYNRLSEVIKSIERNGILSILDDFKTGSSYREEECPYFEKKITVKNLPDTVICTSVKNKNNKTIGVFEIVVHLKDQLKKKTYLDSTVDQYRMLADNIPNTDVYLYDKKLCFLVSNGEQMLKRGLSPENLEGSTRRESKDRNTGYLLKPCYREALKGNIDKKEIFYDNNYYLVKTVPLKKSGEVKGGIAFVQNIDASKKKDEKVKITEKQLKYTNRQMKAQNQQLRASKQQLNSQLKELKTAQERDISYLQKPYNISGLVGKLQGVFNP